MSSNIMLVVFSNSSFIFIWQWKIEEKPNFKLLCFLLMSLDINEGEIMDK